MRYLALALTAALALPACSDRDEPAPGQAEQSGAAPNAAMPSPPLAQQTVAGMRWTYSEEGPGALFGPPDAEAVVALDCLEVMPDQKGMALAWIAPADEDATKPLTISDGMGNSIELLMNATASVEGPDFYWEGLVQSDSPESEFLSRSRTPFTFALDGREIALPATDTMARVIETCR